MSSSIFMIHGMWGGAWYWQPYSEWLGARGYACQATTLPFHDVMPYAAPDPQLGRTSLLDYADALEREIRALPTAPILMGHSMGGLLAQMLAARGVGRAAVLLAPAAPAGIVSLTPSVLRSFLPVMLRWGFWRKPMRQPFGTAVYSMLHKLPPEQQREVYGHFVYESGRAASEIGLWPLDRRRAAAVDAEAVDCPMLVVAGTEDRITPTSVVRQIARRYNASYREFAGHAHWLVAEPGWETIAGAVADWMDGLAPA